MSANWLASSGIPNHAIAMIAMPAVREATAMRQTDTVPAPPGPSSAGHSRKMSARADGSRSSKRASGGAVVQDTRSAFAGPSTRRTASYGHAANGAPSGASTATISSLSEKLSLTTRRRLDSPSKNTAPSMVPLQAEVETVGQPLTKPADQLAGGGNVRGTLDVDYRARADHPLPDPLHRVDPRQHP